jgi:methylglutaconyl-CoA hydratase
MTIRFNGKFIKVIDNDHGVKKIIFSRPDTRNAFTENMIQEITEQLILLAQITPIEEMRLLIIEGEGKVFSAGADLNYMKQQAQQSEEKNLQDALNLGKMFFTLAAFPCPVVCIVQGAAIGGGFGFVACADLTIAEQKAVFATSEVRLGIVPGVISPYVIRKIGVAASSQFLLSGKRFSANESQQLGLIQYITEQEYLKEKTEMIMHELLMAGPHAARRTKELILNASQLPSLKQIEFTAKQIALARSSHEGKSGIEAFFAKKDPYWSVREQK